MGKIIFYPFLYLCWHFNQERGWVCIFLRLECIYPSLTLLFPVFISENTQCQLLSLVMACFKKSPLITTKNCIFHFRGQGNTQQSSFNRTMTLHSSKTGISLCPKTHITQIQFRLLKKLQCLPFIICFPIYNILFLIEMLPNGSNGSVNIRSLVNLKLISGSMGKN